MPILSTERRLELEKQAKQHGEDCRVSIRNIRRDAIDVIKKHEKNSVLGKDVSKGYQVTSRM